MIPILVEQSQRTPVDRLQVEIVERKGIGHPDTICDAIVEDISIALCREYLDRCGRVLHHNIDKALLVAGQTKLRLGGGKVLEPMQFICGDRATSEYNGIRLNIAEIAEETARQWVQSHLRHADNQYLTFQSALKSGSDELMGIFGRKLICANDTSAAVGYAPATETERLVRVTENYINSDQFKELYPETGEDVKVMGYRTGRKLLLTLAIAFVDRYFNQIADYYVRKEEVRQNILHFLNGQLHNLESVEIHINTLDNPQAGLAGAYLTVLGTSAEHGDGGQVGRGNQPNGIISLQRPRGSEAVAGKNPLSHVGKIYSLLAQHIAEEIYQRLPDLAEVTVWLGSQIGRPLDQPVLASVQLLPQGPVAIAEYNSKASEMVRGELEDISAFTMRLARGEFPVC